MITPRTKLHPARRVITGLTGGLAASPIWSTRTRAAMMRRLGAKLGPGVRINSHFRFIGGAELLTIGSGSFVNVNLLIGSSAPVTVGENVFIGPNVSLLPTTHEMGDSHKRAGATTSAAIHIGNGSWLGAGVTVLGGVSIGSGCVIAAGAVVTEDCADNGLFAGTPARFIKDLP